MLFLQYKLFYFDGKRYISYIMPIRLALVGDPLPHGKTLSSAIESRRGTFSHLISILIKENKKLSGEILRAEDFTITLPLTILRELRWRRQQKGEEITD